MTMRSEPTLFDFVPSGRLSGRDPLSHREDPLTSYIAADRLVRSGRHKNIKKAVLEALRAHDGSTSGELGRYLGRDWLYAARRLPELETDGLVRKGEPRICECKGTKCVTWWVTGQAK
jgi:hypothetical protein